MHIVRLHYLIAAAIICVGGCKSTQPVEPHVRPLEATLGPGWQCFLTPTGFNAPGTIFTVDSRGVIRDEADLSQLFATQTQDRLFGAATWTKGISLGFSLALLAGAIKNVSADVNASLRETATVTISIGGGREERSYLKDYEVARRWVAEHQQIYHGDRRVFVVRNAFLVKDIKYRFDAEALRELGGEVKFKQLATITGSTPSSVSQDGKPAVYDLDLKLPEHLRLCVLPDELVLGKLVDATPAVEIKSVTTLPVPKPCRAYKCSKECRSTSGERRCCEFQCT
jgi:hypothetical protein